MHALNDPEPPLPPLLLPLLELDGLLPQALRTSVAAATPASTAPVRFICTDGLPLDVEPDGRAGSGPGPGGPEPGRLRGLPGHPVQSRPSPLRSVGGALLIAHVHGWSVFMLSCRGRYQRPWSGPRKEPEGVL